MELDTAVRQKLPLLCIVSLNSGWTGRPGRQQTRPRYLGRTRYEIMVHGLRCHGEYVDQPEDIPALERAQKKVDEGMVALVNVKTDYRARATTVRFSSRET